MVKVLVVGKGGREHALGYGLALSKEVDKVYFVPGNAGTALLAKATNVEVSHDQLTEFCRKESINLVVIGPDDPLVAGLADELRAQGITTFGPGKAAAQLEGSKSFATEFMQNHGIPIPPSTVVTDAKSAAKAVAAYGGAAKSVIKADGLAGGKGVFLPDTEEEAEAAIARIISGDVDGGREKFVIQQRYHGPEVSVFALSDGDTYQIIPLPAQDHKRIFNGDKGPNTGGVGAYAPLPDWMLSSGQWSKIESIIDKTISGMQAAGTPYQGVLFLGVMLAEELNGDPIVIEYNCRFGDPEIQVVMSLLIKNQVDAYQMLNTTATGHLAQFVFPNKLYGSALTICLSTPGYPGTPKGGQTIYGLDKSYPNVIVFHGTTKQVDGEIQTNGGRMIFAVGMGDTLKEAAAAAAAAIGPDAIHFKGMHYRTDIGHRALIK